MPGISVSIGRNSATSKSPAPSRGSPSALTTRPMRPIPTGVLNTECERFAISSSATGIVRSIKKTETDVSLS